MSRSSTRPHASDLFSYAGGSAAVYRALQASLPGIEVRRHELAGRGSRLSEPAVRDMSTLVDTLLRDTDDCFDRPFALLGHSMGAAIAAELALRLPAHARPNLRHLFVSARAAPGHERHDRRMQALDDRAFIDALREMGGTPRAVLDNSELMALLMPALRADFTMIENHRPVPGPGWRWTSPRSRAGRIKRCPSMPLKVGAPRRPGASIFTSSTEIISFEKRNADDGRHHRGAHAAPGARRIERTAGMTGRSSRSACRPVP